MERLYLIRAPGIVDAQNPQKQSLTLNVAYGMATNTHKKLRHPIKMTQGNLRIVTPGEDTDQGALQITFGCGQAPLWWRMFGQLQSLVHRTHFSFLNLALPIAHVID